MYFIVIMVDDGYIYNRITAELFIIQSSIKRFRTYRRSGRRHKLLISQRSRIPMNLLIQEVEGGANGCHGIMKEQNDLYTSDTTFNWLDRSWRSCICP